MGSQRRELFGRTTTLCRGLVHAHGLPELGQDEGSASNPDMESQWSHRRISTLEILALAGVKA